MNRIDLIRGISTYVEEEWEDFEDGGGVTTSSLNFYFRDPSQYDEYEPFEKSLVRFFRLEDVGKNPKSVTVMKEKQIVQALKNALEDYYYQHLTWFEWFKIVVYIVTSPTRED